MGKTYNQYLLKEDKAIDGKIFLKYSQTINGYTGDAAKALHFGSIYYDKNNLMFDSEYVQKNME
ncbi:hypothetical protein [Chryseobacterium lactis]|uniref:hypothetical protein n=1 Tax=Chryseobacterium lactis TaxID=1241981 RepID=UPI0016291B12|nr:hypothetical protein [Chryseobacterium lactis]